MQSRGENKSVKAEKTSAQFVTEAPLRICLDTEVRACNAVQHLFYRSHLIADPFL